MIFSISIEGNNEGENTKKIIKAGLQKTSIILQSITNEMYFITSK